MKLCHDAAALLGEGALWDDRKKVLYWIDIRNKQLHKYDPATEEKTAYEIGQYIGTVALTEDDRLLLALQDGIALFDEATQHLEWLNDLEKDQPANRCNDGKCSPDGYFWVGTLAISLAPDAGSFYRVAPDGSYQKFGGAYTIPNGLGWSPDGRTLYHVESNLGYVTAYDYEAGNITNERVIIRVPKHMGGPDGMAIDAEGMLWIAHYGGSCVRRWNPATGEVLQQIDLPVSQITTCTFGGEDLRDLYITTARQGLEDGREPLAGGLFCIKTDVKGLLSYRWQV